MNSNMPVLWVNCLDMYRESPIAQKAWVWFTETRSKCRYHYDSDSYAEEVCQLVSFLRPKLKKAGKAHNADAEVLDDLLKFILKRHANYKFGGNVKMWWEFDND